METKKSQDSISKKEKKKAPKNSMSKILTFTSVY